jgi:hypothetical protein
MHTTRLIAMSLQIQRSGHVKTHSFGANNCHKLWGLSSALILVRCLGNCALDSWQKFKREGVNLPLDLQSMHLRVVVYGVSCAPSAHETLLSMTIHDYFHTNLNVGYHSRIRP